MVCATLAFVCVVTFSDLAFGIGHGAVIADINPFILIGLVEYTDHALWLPCLLFGAWAVLLPPRRWWALAFYLAAVAAGVWASRSYQVFEWPEYPFQAGMEHITPTFQWVSLTTVASCAVALASAAVCAFAGRRLVCSRQSSRAFQPTASGHCTAGGSHEA